MSQIIDCNESNPESSCYDVEKGATNGNKPVLIETRLSCYDVEKGATNGSLFLAQRGASAKYSAKYSSCAPLFSHFSVMFAGLDVYIRVENCEKSCRLTI